MVMATFGYFSPSCFDHWIVVWIGSVRKNRRRSCSHHFWRSILNDSFRNHHWYHNWRSHCWNHDHWRCHYHHWRCYNYYWRCHRNNRWSHQSHWIHRHWRNYRFEQRQYNFHHHWCYCPNCDHSNCDSSDCDSSNCNHPNHNNWWLIFNWPNSRDPSGSSRLYNLHNISSNNHHHLVNHRNYRNLIKLVRSIW